MKATLKLFSSKRNPTIEFRKAFTLTLYFCKPRGLLQLRSKLLRLRNLSSFCRVAFGFKDFVYETVERSARYVSVKKFMKANKVAHRIDIELPQVAYEWLFEQTKVLDKSPNTLKAQKQTPKLLDMLVDALSLPKQRSIKAIYRLLASANKPQIKVKY